MDEKQAKLKKNTTTAFLVVSCVTAAWFFLSGMFRFIFLFSNSNGSYHYISNVFGTDNFFNYISPILKDICHSCVTAFSTFLYLRHIKFKRSVPIGTANLIVLSILACMCVFNIATETGISIARLIFTVIYGFISSRHFFSNKIMRRTFTACVLSFVVMEISFLDSDIELSNLSSPLSTTSAICNLLTLCLIIAYGICEMLALNHSSGWFCENCGNKNGDKHLFCTKCGAKNPFIND